MAVYENKYKLKIFAVFFLMVNFILILYYNNNKENNKENDKKNINTKIPKIIHQSWKSNEIPKKFDKWVNSWKNYHQDWEYKLWTDKDNRKLIEDHYPWFLEIYDSFPFSIMRADASRYFYLHKYGGLYTDLDIEALKPLDKYITNYDLILGSMEDIKKTASKHSIPNAWMLSKPEHPFWLLCIQYIVDKYKNNLNWNNVYVEGVTGPIMLFDVYDDYKNNVLSNIHSIHIFNPDIIYSYNWEKNNTYSYICEASKDTFDENECKRLFITKNSIAISYWSHTW